MPCSRPAIASPDPSGAYLVQKYLGGSANSGTNSSNSGGGSGGSAQAAAAAGLLLAAALARVSAEA